MDMEQLEEEVHHAKKKLEFTLEMAHNAIDHAVDMCRYGHNYHRFNRSGLTACPYCKRDLDPAKSNPWMHYVALVRQYEAKLAEAEHAARSRKASLRTAQRAGNPCFEQANDPRTGDSGDE